MAAKIYEGFVYGSLRDIQKQQAKLNASGELPTVGELIAVGGIEFEVGEILPPNRLSEVVVKPKLGTVKLHTASEPAPLDESDGACFQLEQDSRRY